VADPNAIRSEMILKDIYARHGIDPSLPIEEQIRAVEDSAAGRGMLPSAWSNPEERAQARAAYAAKGKTDAEKQARWDESVYLLDPDTYQYQQNAGRDIDFLTAMDEASRRDPNAARSSAAVGAAGGIPAAPRTPSSGVAGALEYWDSSNGSPLYRESVLGSNYQSQDGVLQGLLNATTNPDVPSGNYLNFSELLPDWVRMRGSGEANSAGEAYEGAQSKRLATNRYRLSSPSPVLDLPSGTDAASKADRIVELQGLVKSAGIPESDQRWARWTKQNLGKSFVPPGFVTDTLDYATSWLDPTAVVPVGGAAVGAAKTMAKGARIAGQGWVRPVLSGLLKNRLHDFKWDMGIEQGIGHGAVGALGGNAERSMPQYLFGNWDPEQKSEEEVQASRDARTRLYDQLKGDNRVSRADGEAYKTLNLRVPASYPSR
jgi:hypothetical protein